MITSYALKKSRVQLYDILNWKNHWEFMKKDIHFPAPLRVAQKEVEGTFAYQQFLLCILGSIG